MIKRLLILLAMVPILSYSQTDKPATINVKMVNTTNIDSIAERLKSCGYRITKKADDISYLRLRPIRYYYNDTYNKLCIEIWLEGESAKLTGYDMKRNPDKLDLIDDDSQKAKSAIRCMQMVADELAKT